MYNELERERKNGTENAETPSPMKSEMILEAINSNLEAIDDIFHEEILIGRKDEDGNLTDDFELVSDSVIKRIEGFALRLKFFRNNTVNR